MIFFDWLKNRKEKKEKEKEIFLKKLELGIQYNNKEKINLSSKEQEDNIKNFIIQRGSEIDEGLIEIVFLMFQSPSFKEKVYKTTYYNKEKNKEITVLSHACDNYNYLSKKSREFLSKSFPIEDYFTLLESSYKDKMYSPLLSVLISDPEVVFDFFNYHGTSFLFDNKNDFVLKHLTDKKNNLTALELLLTTCEKYSNKNRLKILNIISNEIVNNKNADQEKINFFMFIVAKNTPELIIDFLDKDIINENNYELTIKTLFQNYTNKSNYFEIIKEVYIRFKEEKDYDTDLFYNKETVDESLNLRWIDEFFKEDVSYDNLVGIIEHCFKNPKEIKGSIYGFNVPAYEINFDPYFEKVKTRKKKVESLIINTIFDNVMEVIEKEKLNKNFEAYLSCYEKYADDKNYNWLIKAIKNGFKLNEDNVVLLKVNNVNPFLKDNNDESILSLSEEPVQQMIYTVFYKERLEEEKKELQQIVNTQKVKNEPKLEEVKKKRL